MIITNKKAFSRGLILMLSFIGIFILFLMPVFPGHEDGTKLTGLECADHLFNTLSKGSANYFDMKKKDNIYTTINKAQGKLIDISVPFKEDQQQKQETALLLLKKAGLEATASGYNLRIKGSLESLLHAMVGDAQYMYNNDGKSVSLRYGGLDAKHVARSWWQLASNMIKPLQYLEQNNEAVLVNAVMTRAIEPGYNFFTITPAQVSDNLIELIGFLAFYVIYTMWYGFAIFELFEGVGLSMKKGKKQEI